MLHSWDADAVRAAEAPLLASGAPLMAHAAFGLAGHVQRVLRDARGRVAGAHAVLLVGPGNNGGDTLHAGALLARRGVAVTAVLASGRVHAAGLVALRSAHGRVLALDAGSAADGSAADGSAADGSVSDAPVTDAVRAALRAADVVLDGLLGLGGRGGVRGPGAWLVAAVVATVPRPLVVAVDVPSGVGVDDGTRAGPVLDADLTVTFGAYKPALLLPPAAAAAGRVVLVGLGLRLDLAPTASRLEAADAAALWPVPARAAQKYGRGVLGVVAGSARYPGAAVLAAAGAVRAGVGMVRYVGSAGPQVIAAHPEVVVGDGRVRAWVVGPGVAPDDGPQRARVHGALTHALRHDEPVVVDAGALELLPDRVPPHVVLTPHAGELAALLAARGEHVGRADVEAAPLAHARRAHELTGATVLLKGEVTVVVGPQGVAYAQADGPAWLATAGAGDVLAGVLGALLAGRSDAAVADPTSSAAFAAAAALVHGLAAHHANPGGPVSATSVADALPAVVAGLLRA
ncbi:bifunctional ADP-dependent NAD(P)H-hydrate dehydratase/NAD(P)H-hydrate epimerase [Cellulomonas sp. S1-8]|uniref:bifunctional ADP-dependent NAD(P)H-hydrate dehydratase/NAD(P)H-hydrate epimerase n=1 Tax=Cellulomonas sp. S1-8 TaxID=2904790 RepID=UPI0022436A7F|nr:bifunctional ADP-dependent NAD(P)H-hydrate dehydratase/NAD(P)H-hydrate epimerase [Cellulomonas sp. S1-8]UZN02209.1 bifunctional ADP-dependent NAD(P)H-hydrate dehydratase/NAD(P)H-hydrate epimerase [Cellulomonas sp. S1-8]